MRWMLLKQLSRFHYQKAASDIIQETGDPAAATAEAIFERGNKTLAENLATYSRERPRKVPRIVGRLATGRAFSLSQVKRPRKKAAKPDPRKPSWVGWDWTLAYNCYEDTSGRNAAKRQRRERRAH